MVLLSLRLLLMQDEPTSIVVKMKISQYKFYKGAHRVQLGEVPAVACTRFKFLGSNFAPKPKKASIRPESLNWYPTCLVRIMR